MIFKLENDHHLDLVINLVYLEHGIVDIPARQLGEGKPF